MSVAVIVSIAMRVVALAWALLIFRRLRDWRLAVLIVILAILVACQVLQLVLPPDNWLNVRISEAADLRALLVGLLALCAVAFFNRYVTEQKRLQAVDSDQQHQLARVLNALPVMVANLDENERYRFVNETYEYVFGHSLAEITGKTVREVVGEEMYIMARPYIAAALSGQSTRFEGQVVLGHLGERYIDASYVPDIDQEGEVHGYFVLISDITDRKATENSLRASESKFRDFTEVASDWYWEMDADLRFIYISSQFSDVAGGEAEGLIGLSRADVTESVLDKEGWRNHLNDLEQHRSFRNFVFARRLKTGEIKNFRVSGKPLFDENGGFRGYRGVGSEISREIEMERDRYKAEVTFSRAIETIPAAFALYDPNDRLVLCNRQYRETYGSAEVPIAPGILYEAVVRGFAAGGHIGESVKEAEEWVVTRLGRRNQPARSLRYRRSHDQWSEVSDFLLEDGSIITVALDVTEEKRAEEALREHEAELARVLRRSTMGEMAAALAHELNQPLTAVTNFASGCVRRVRSGQLDLEELPAIMEQLHAQARRASDVLRQVGAFIRHSVSEKHPLELRETIDSVVAIMDGELRSRGIRLKQKVPSHLPKILAARIELEQVLVNLIRNAIEAMEEVPRRARTLSIEAEITGADTLEVRVADSGPGLSAAAREACLEPFFTTKRGGMGMGLSISKRIIEAHGGTLTLRNRTEGGACISFSLPTDLKDAKHAA